MIERDVALVVSGGRTGTSFLGRWGASMIEDAWSVHEPDLWRGVRDRRSWRAIRWFGPYHVTLGKVFRRTGMLALTRRYRSGEWSDERTARAIVRQRKAFYSRISAGLVIESNYQWYGLLPLLPIAFRSYRVLGSSGIRGPGSARGSITGATTTRRTC